MDDNYTFLGKAVIASSVLLVSPLYGFFTGAFTGWVVGLVFSDTFAAFITWLGVGMQPWQVGGMLGFVSGFLRRQSA